ncbi:hypothetical protein SAMN04487981_102741 [Streptomyces sp. cf386]|nr:hypothetical protein SAMN04487981_102741 [Streptomyces sp. cf386]
MPLRGPAVGPGAGNSGPVPPPGGGSPSAIFLPETMPVFSQAVGRPIAR